MAEEAVAAKLSLFILGDMLDRRDCYSGGSEECYAKSRNDLPIRNIHKLYASGISNYVIFIVH